MLEQILNWLSSQEGSRTLLISGVQVKADVRYWPPDSSALVADFDSRTSMGRITIWGTGACEIEVLRIEDGMTIYRRSRTETSFDDFRVELTLFLETMAT